jgi:hypothetical protein
MHGSSAVIQLVAQAVAVACAGMSCNLFRAVMLLGSGVCMQGNGVL